MEAQWSTPTAPQAQPQAEGRRPAAAIQVSSHERDTIITACVAGAGAADCPEAADEAGSCGANDAAAEAGCLAEVEAVVPMRHAGSGSSNVGAAAMGSDPLFAVMAAVALLPGMPDGKSPSLPLRRPAALAAASAAARTPDVVSDGGRQATDVRPAALAVSAADAPCKMQLEESCRDAEDVSSDGVGLAEDAHRPAEATVRQSAVAYQALAVQPEGSTEGAAFLRREDRARVAHEGEDEDQCVSADLQYWCGLRH